MKYIIGFLHQRAPRAGKEMPPYYLRALVASETILAIYFLISFFLFGLALNSWEWMPMALYMGVVLGLKTNCAVNVRYSIYGYGLIVITWCAWHTYTVGWGCGAQHFLIPVLLLCIFNIYDPPWVKVAFAVALVSYRMGLFAYSLGHEPFYSLGTVQSVVFQTINSLTLFLALSVEFILLSSSIQETERQLRLDNQELHKEAGTDPLTQLPNRRAMMDVVEMFIQTCPQENYSIAIADIDFFKKVNDTYGHNCGDYTLKALAELFRSKAGEVYRVCRWGGEEFCFFMPGLNIDQAGLVMFDLCHAVPKMPLTFDDKSFNITVTIGVAENDFESSMEDILEVADQKLYMGKLGGRNQVVV